MKISKLFHTLYGCLMALPIFVIPIFAININQKEVEPISITIGEQEVINFNQLLNIDTLKASATYYDVDVTNNSNGSFTFNGTSTNNFDLVLTNNISILANHIYIFKTIEGGEYFYKTWIYQGGAESFTKYTRVQVNTDRNVQIRGSAYNNATYDFTFYPQVFDLTQMFGAGFEPSNEEFDLWFTQEYYPYVTTKRMVITIGTVTYNNTDIGSQFLYSIYKPVNDYFNFKDFMGLGSLYDWIQLNIFISSNSLVFFILFNLFTYWIFVSFFWLIFDVLMYVPSLVHKMLDKARLE